jgi:hypothetical protein
LFVVAAKDRTTPVPDGPGNVLDSSPEGNRLHGDQGNPILGIGRNLVDVARSRRKR